VLWWAKADRYVIYCFALSSHTAYSSARIHTFAVNTSFVGRAVRVYHALGSATDPGVTKESSSANAS
jgi:hypothetical protein